jgi:patatin-like phospholipase/acyl hydrolase
LLRVLSIDGGGIRGIIPATVLVELEKICNKRIFQLFDLIAGTSTGGILALGLTAPRLGALPPTASELRNLYLERGHVIFPLGGRPVIGVPRGGLRGTLLGERPPLREGATLTERFKHFMGWNNIAKLSAPLGGSRLQGNARYAVEPLEEQLRAQVGETMMSQALKPVEVVSYDFRLETPLVIRGGGLDQSPLGDIPMWQAARATSAGPTFFQAMILRDPTGLVRECVDGGLVANDPAFLAYTDALRILASIGRTGEEVLLVSLGTGLKERAQSAESQDVPQLVDQRSWLQLGPKIIGALGSAGGDLVRNQLSLILGNRYVRLQTELKFGATHEMDNVESANLQALKRTGDDLVTESRPILDRLKSVLAA